MPTGDTNPGKAFLAWQRYSQETPDFRVGRIVDGGCASDLAPEVLAAYDAPFPDDRYNRAPVPAAGPNPSRRPRGRAQPASLEGA